MKNVGNIHVTGSEAKGARKMLAALKRVGLVQKAVRLQGTVARKRKANPRTVVIARRARRVVVNSRRPARRRNIAAGFRDEDGIFYPIRASFDYNAGRAGESRRKKTTGRKKTAKGKKKAKR